MFGNVLLQPKTKKWKKKKHGNIFPLQKNLSVAINTCKLTSIRSTYKETIPVEYIKTDFQTFMTHEIDQFN